MDRFLFLITYLLGYMYMHIKPLDICGLWRFWTRFLVQNHHKPYIYWYFAVNFWDQKIYIKISVVWDHFDIEISVVWDHFDIEISVVWDHFDFEISVVWDHFDFEISVVWDHFDFEILGVNYISSSAKKA